MVRRIPAARKGPPSQERSKALAPSGESRFSEVVALIEAAREPRLPGRQLGAGLPLLAASASTSARRSRAPSGATASSTSWRRCSRAATRACVGTRVETSSGCGSSTRRIGATEESVTAGDTIAVDASPDHPRARRSPPRRASSTSSPPSRSAGPSASSNARSDPAPYFARACFAKKVSPAVTQIHPTAIDELKNAYNLEFLGLSAGHSEADLHGSLALEPWPLHHRARPRLLLRRFAVPGPGWQPGLRDRPRLLPPRPAVPRRLRAEGRKVQARRPGRQARRSTSRRSTATSEAARAPVHRRPALRDQGRRGRRVRAGAHHVADARRRVPDDAPPKAVLRRSSMSSTRSWPREPNRLPRL